MNTFLEDKAQHVLDNLISRNLITQAACVKLQKEYPKASELFDYLVKEDLLDKEDLVRAIAEVNNIPYINLTNVDFQSKTLELIPRDIALENMAVSLGLQGDKLVVAMVEADDIIKANYLRQLISKYPLTIYMASEESVSHALGQYEVKIPQDSDLTPAIKKPPAKEDKANKKGFFTPFRSKEATVTDASLQAESPASKTLLNILQYAAVVKASDIHIEALEDSVRVRVRIDGVLRLVTTYKKDLEAALIAKIKILAQLKVDEKRLPQDGEFVINVRGRNIDLRVATSPVVWGEQVIIRLLDRSGTVMGLENLGYQGRTLGVIKEALKQSSGMILTSGPTGSGKTTSLYTLIQEIHSDSIKIITLEDPPEYKMEGVNQIQVNSSIGLTFATGLRSILRQDPDVVMVGEIRDEETAGLAIQASLTGHLVFSTLHTNSAAGILPRLLDMGIEPFLISSTIRVVIGQRLLRRNANSDNLEDLYQYESSPTETEKIKIALENVLPSRQQSDEEIEEINNSLGYHNLPFIEDTSFTLYKADTDDPNEAFKGRVGIYEAFPISDAIQKLIVEKATSSAIQAQAQEEGMITMRQDGYLKALAGLTTINEVDRVIAENNV